MRFKIFTLVLFSVGLYACGSKNGAQNTNNQPKRLIKLVSPSNNSTVIKGNSIKVELNIKPNANLKIDSVIWTLGKTTKGRLNIDNPTENISTQNLSVGKNKLFVKAYKSDGTQENKFAQIKILSNIEPKLYGYKVIREYPHNNTFYTQGLLVNNNILYESTGQRGMSKLLKYDLESKSVINEYDLPKSFFGEGLAFLNDKLYQITWTSGQGFVYNANDLRPMGSFSINGEGWGLTTNGNHLIMSSGSNELQFINPETFKTDYTLEVMDNKKAITKLNELEYVNGEIWANYYEFNNFLVYRINAKTGEVNGVIDFTGIVKKEDFHQAQDVFNGIAYDAKNDRYFVTGKNYNKIYEVEITEK